MMTTVFILSFCGGLAALAPFASGMHEGTGDVQQLRISANVSDLDAVNDAIADQEALDRTCSDEPTLTESIVFEWAEPADVEVLGFDEAYEASARKAGWVRAYCS